MCFVSAAQCGWMFGSSGSAQPPPALALRDRHTLGPRLRLADFLRGQAGAQVDRRARLRAGLHVARRYVDDAVGVDLERHFDRHLAARRDTEAGELELA